MTERLLFTYENKTKEGYTSIVPLQTSHLTADTILEIEGYDVLEKVENFIAFLDDCYRLLLPGSKASFTSPHYASSQAWQSPLNKRAISEKSLNFASKAWREANKYTEASVICDFTVTGSFAMEEAVLQRSDEARAFWMTRYTNVAQAIMFELVKL